MIDWSVVLIRFDEQEKKSKIFFSFLFARPQSLLFVVVFLSFCRFVCLSHLPSISILLHHHPILTSSSSVLVVDKEFLPHRQRQTTHNNRQSNTIMRKTEICIHFMRHFCFSLLN